MVFVYVGRKGVEQYFLSGLVILMSIGSEEAFLYVFVDSLYGVIGVLMQLEVDLAGAVDLFGEIDARDAFINRQADLLHIHRIISPGNLRFCVLLVVLLFLVDARADQVFPFVTIVVNDAG